jgi:hypothetical protein
VNKEFEEKITHLTKLLKISNESLSDYKAKLEIQEGEAMILQRHVDKMADELQVATAAKTLLLKQWQG